MDSTSLEPLPILVFTNIVMVGFLLLIGRKGLREPYALRPWRRVLMLSLMLLFCIFSFSLILKIFLKINTIFQAHF